jgi:hypothetical protein
MEATLCLIKYSDKIIVPEQNDILAKNRFEIVILVPRNISFIERPISTAY